MTDTTRPAWPYTVFADQLRTELARHHDDRMAYDHGRGTGASVVTDIAADARQRMALSESIVERLNQVLDGERVRLAFGDEHTPSSEEGIRALATDIIDIYADLASWGRMTLGCRVEERYSLLYRALANLVRSPLQSIEDFTEDVTERATTLDQELSAGQPPSVTFSLTLRLTIDDLDLAAYNEALREVTPQRRRWFRRR